MDSIQLLALWIRFEYWTGGFDSDTSEVDSVGILDKWIKLRYYVNRFLKY
jgi:hypothetical protein